MADTFQVLNAFDTLGDLLRYFRRRAQLSQAGLSVAVGYSVSQISRIESNQRSMDRTSLLSLFVPALHLENEPEAVRRLLELAARPLESAKARHPEAAGTMVSSRSTSKSSGRQPSGQQGTIQTALAAPRNNLPAQVTPLIGREGAVDEVVELLSKPNCHLLTLTGQGGIGKTRLALQAAAQIAEHAPETHPVPDGVFFYELHGTEEPTFLAQAFIDAIGLRISGADDPRKRLVQLLQAQKMLLVMDNFEEILQCSPDAAQSALNLLVDIVKQAPQVKLLVVSRVVLNLSEEWVYPVKGLSYPHVIRGAASNAAPGEASTRVPTQEDLSRYAAVRLFIERARHVQPVFSVEDEMIGIIQICQAVEGLPLALEMAAVWTKMMSCAAIAAEIQRNLTFLETRYKDIPVRHRNVLAVINQSWQALSPEERQVYARLSVFKGGFTRHAAEQVAGANLSILSALVDQSLLRWEPGDHYQIHELLRQFAQDQLQADPEAAYQTLQRHSLYYADFLARYSAEITGPYQQEVLQSITAELQNIREAWRRAIEDMNLLALQKAAHTYYLFCDFTSRYRDGAEAFEQAITRIVESGNIGPHSAGVMALLKTLLGYHHIRLGRYDAAKQAYQSAQTLLQTYRLDVKPGFGTDPFNGMGLLALVNGDYAGSIAYAESARDASLAHHDPLNLQIACYVLANAALSTGDYPQALIYTQQGLDSTEVTGNRWMEAHLLGVQGQIAQAQRQYALAQRKYQESCQIKKELIDLEGEANSLNHMAAIALLQGNFLEGHQIYMKSLDIFLHIYDPGGLGSTYLGLGNSALARGDFPVAGQYFRQGLQIAIQIHWLPLIIALLTGVSELLLWAERAEQSATLLHQILAHPAISQDARLHARQILDRVLDQVGPTTAAQPAAYTGDDLLKTSHTVLVELAHLTFPTSPGQNHPASENASTDKGLLDPLTAREI